MIHFIINQEHTDKDSGIILNALSIINTFKIASQNKNRDSYVQ
jgi:hypothetical protein